MGSIASADKSPNSTSEALGLILISDDLIGISTTFMVRRLRPEVRVVVRMFNQNLIARMGSAVANIQTLSVSGLAAPLSR